jgi:hypothetical protein
MEYGGTAHNRTVYASGAVAPSGYEKPQSGYALGAVFLRHIFAVAGMLRIPFIATAKTSYTAGTLCAIWAKFFLKYCDKHIV